MTKPTTDWETEFDKKFMCGNTTKPELLLRDGNAYLMTLIKQFIKNKLARAREDERKQIMREAGAVFVDWNKDSIYD